MPRRVRGSLLPMSEPVEIMTDGANPTPDEDEPDQAARALEEHEEDEAAVSEPAKLLRIALMLRGMQEEVRRADTDEAGRERLRIIHERALDGLHTVLSDDLREELDRFTLPFDEGVPTESEILISQAQLIGWLEGLFQGIQAAIASQQFMAKQQLQQMRQRGLPQGAGPDGGHGQYL